MRSMFLGVLLALLLLLVSSADVAKETKSNEVQTAQSGEVKEPEQQYGGRCRYGCCRWGGPYGCRRCCFDTKEAQAMELIETDNQKAEEVKEPEQYGGRCYYGCCGPWYYGRCSRCCRGAEEARAAKTQINNQQANEGVDGQVNEQGHV